VCSTPLSTLPLYLGERLLGRLPVMKFVIEIELPEDSIFKDDEESIRQYLVYILNQHAIKPHVKQVMIDDSP
jgi:hypothetical protein